MRRNGYLWTSGVNLDTAVRFGDHDFLSQRKISATWRRFPLIFALCMRNMLNVRYISTSGSFFLLTKKVYHTRWPHVDNSHQVWSWYDYPLPSYSVFVCRYGTWPCDLDLLPVDLEQLSWMAGHVSNLATKYEDATHIRSWVMSYNVSLWLPLKMRPRPLRMRRITWPVSRGSKTITYLESPSPICYATFIGLRRRLRVVYSRAVQC